MRMTRTTRTVIEAFLEEPAADLHGYDLLKRTGIKGGSLYPVLERLEREGWIVGTWKESSIEGRPRRKCYTLTGLGLRQAKLETLEAPSLMPRPVGDL